MFKFKAFKATLSEKVTKFLEGEIQSDDGRRVPF